MHDSAQQPATYRIEGDVFIVSFVTNPLCRHKVNDAIAALDRCGLRSVIFDFSNIRYLLQGSLFPNDEPLQPLLAINKRRKDGWQVILCSLSPEITNVFRITRLDTVLEICIDVESALHRLRNMPFVGVGGCDRNTPTRLS